MAVCVCRWETNTVIYRGEDGSRQQRLNTKRACCSRLSSEPIILGYPWWDPYFGVCTAVLIHRLCFRDFDRSCWCHLIDWSRETLVRRTYCCAEKPSPPYSPMTPRSNSALSICKKRERRKVQGEKRIRRGGLLQVDLNRHRQAGQRANLAATVNVSSLMRLVIQVVAFKCCVRVEVRSSSCRILTCVSDYSRS